MTALFLCEESQACTIAFRKKGIEAFSCDLKETSGSHPEWHIKGDALEVMRGKWDFLFGFPPCTALAVSGSRHFAKKQKSGEQAKAIEFAFQIWKRIKEVGKGGFENPISILSRHIGKPSQIIHPWQFGHAEEKTTCLWLYGLPLLEPSNNVWREFTKLPYQSRNRLYLLPPSADRGSLRSKTFPGVAAAMAEQWSNPKTLFNL